MIHTFVCTKLLLIGTVYHHWLLFLQEFSKLDSRLLFLHQRSSSQAAGDLILLLPKSSLKLFVVKKIRQIAQKQTYQARVAKCE